MKKHPEHKIDELLHGSLHNLHGETSAQDWAEIQRRLQKEGKDKPWFWFIGSRKGLSVLALLLLSFAGIGYYGLNKSTQKTAQTAFAENNNAAQLQAKKQSDITVNSKGDNNANKNANLVNDRVENQTIKSEKSNNEIIKDKNFNKGAENIPHYSKSFKLSENTKRHALRNTFKKSDEPNKFDATEKNNSIRAEIESTKTEIYTDNKTAENLSSLVQDSVINEIDKNLADAKSDVKTPVADQLNTVKKTKKLAGKSGKKLSVGFSFTPGFSGGKININSAKTAQVHKDYYALRTSQQQPSTTYNTSIFAQYNIWKSLNVQSGIAYYKQTETVNYKFYNNHIPVIDSASGNILGYIIIEDTIRANYTGRNTYNYVQIPLNIGYEFPLSSKWSVNVQAGGSAMFLLGAKGQTIRTDDLTLTEINNLRKTNWAISFSPTIYYKLHKYFSVGLEANYSQLLNPVQNKNATTQTKPLNMGAGVNLRFFPF